MFLGWFWACAVIAGTVFAMVNGRGGAVSAAAVDGAAKAVELCIAMAGPLALWAGLGRLMERVGLTDGLAKLLSPILSRLFPASRTDPELAGQLSANVLEGCRCFLDGFGRERCSWGLYLQCGQAGAGRPPPR